MQCSLVTLCSCPYVLPNSINILCSFNMPSTPLFSCPYVRPNPMLLQYAFNSPLLLSVCVAKSYAPLICLQFPFAPVRMRGKILCSFNMPSTRLCSCLCSFNMPSTRLCSCPYVWQHPMLLQYALNLPFLLSVCMATSYAPSICLQLPFAPVQMCGKILCSFNMPSTPLWPGRGRGEYCCTPQPYIFNWAWDQSRCGLAWCSCAPVRS